MSLLINLENVSLAYGLLPLLDEVKLQVSSGERVCLIGRNGAGKSSLLKIIEGAIMPDSGTIWRKPQLRIARLEQELPRDLSITVYEYVSQGLEAAGTLLAKYHALTMKLGDDASEQTWKEFERLQHEIDAINGWQFEQNIKTILMRLQLNADTPLNTLSGGWQRRAALAKALVSSPELILLDEPTNHLDIEAIQWLEEQLLATNIGIVFITHDRALLRRLATRIIELDRGNLTSWPGDYDNFLLRKEEMLHAESKHNADFDKKLAQEEVWIRQGIKARRTRNEGRVRALEALRLERSERREVQGRADFNLNEAAKSGALVFEVKNITHQFNGKNIIKDFSLRVMRGDRLGLIGPNGIGKSTLLNILLGNLTPTQGEVTQGTRLQIAYFDQLRDTLDPTKTVIDNVAGGRQFIEIGERKLHIISYLGDFLFTPQRAMTPVSALSGGECNRLLLAKLFSQPSNLLVMDEPTNDLDIETLELLEELLDQYKGTLLLVSHDRAFLDAVVTSVLVFEGEGKIGEYIGGYQDWQRLKAQNKPTTSAPVSTKTARETTREVKKLSFKEQRELASLPSTIEMLENKQLTLQTQMADAGFYKQPQESINKVLEELKQIEAELEHAYKRWAELDS